VSNHNSTSLKTSSCLSGTEQNVDFSERKSIYDISTGKLSPTVTLCFVQHTPQVHFDELAPSIISRMSRFPPSHPSYPHPSLLNAMYLIASYYLSSPSHPAHIDRRVKWNPAEVGQRFLTKSRKHMLAETPKSEYLVDFVLSMGLMTRYFFWTMRLGEGFQQGLGTLSPPSIPVSEI
jgi:hypothetical protein